MFELRSNEKRPVVQHSEYTRDENDKAKQQSNTKREATLTAVFIILFLTTEIYFQRVRLFYHISFCLYIYIFCFTIELNIYNYYLS